MNRKAPADRRNALLTGLILFLVAAAAILILRWTDRPPPPRFVYRTVDGVNLTLDLYRPDDWAVGDKRSCVIWFFGGGWEVGAPFQYSRQAKELADLGIVSVTPDYRVKSRHGSDVTPFDALEDARSAIAWVRDHADQLGIDPGRVAAAGGSSGGHLAAACATIITDGASSGGSGTGSLPDALILFNPVVDFEIPFVAKQTNRNERERLREIAPIHQMKTPLPPTLIFHGTADPIVPINTSEKFVERANANGSPRVELIRYPGKGHEFHLAGAAARREYRKTLDEIIRFLDSLGWTPGR
jgi:acetyl esterase/lipase